MVLKGVPCICALTACQITRYKKSERTKEQGAHILSMPFCGPFGWNFHECAAAADIE